MAVLEDRAEAVAALHLALGAGDRVRELGGGEVTGHAATVLVDAADVRAPVEVAAVARGLVGGEGLAHVADRAVAALVLEAEGVARVELSLLAGVLTLDLEVAHEGWRQLDLAGARGDSGLFVERAARRRPGDRLWLLALGERLVAAAPLRVEVLAVATQDPKLHAAVLRVRRLAVGGVESAVRTETGGAQPLRVDAVLYEVLHDAGRARSRLASKNQCRRLILETPYYSIPDLFNRYAPIYPVNALTHFKFPTGEYLKEVNAPVTIFHGNADRVIPLSCAAKLKKVLKPGDEFITIDKGSHNDLNDFPLFHAKLDSDLSL